MQLIAWLKHGGLIVTGDALQSRPGKLLPFVAAFAALPLLLPFAPRPAAAQSEPLVITVGFAPGGAADLVARRMTASLSNALGRPVIVMNRPGDGGLTAAEEFQSARADGSQLLLVSIHSEKAGVAPAVVRGRLSKLTPIAVTGVGTLTYGIFAQAHTPAAITHNLERAVVAALNSPGVRQTIESGGGSPTPSAGSAGLARAIAVAREGYSPASDAAIASAAQQGSPGGGTSQPPAAGSGSGGAIASQPAPAGARPPQSPGARPSPAPTTPPASVGGGSVPPTVIAQQGSGGVTPPAQQAAGPDDAKFMITGGCFFYEKHVSLKTFPHLASGWTWTGQCRAGQPISGRGTVTHQHQGTGERLTGSFVNGYKHGQFTSESWDPGGKMDPVRLTYNMGCGTTIAGCTPAAASGGAVASGPGRPAPTAGGSSSGTQASGGSAAPKPPAKPERVHLPHMEAHKCLSLITGKTLYGGFRNSCSFAVGFAWCAYRPKPDAWNASFDCEKPRGIATANSVAAHDSSAHHTGGGARIHWFACRRPDSEPRDIRFEPGRGLVGMCAATGD